jgi:SAM-dependent methyltransferase
MSLADKIKWDKKYSQNKSLFAYRPPSMFVRHYFDLAPNKKALDVACGGGRNTLFLQDLGFEIDAIDISSIALEELAKSINSNVKLIEADLDEYEFEKEKYGFIVMANFLDRKLIEKLKESLVDNGIFIVETYVEDELNEKKFNKDFMLYKNELKELFKDFEIIEYDEFMNEAFEVNRMKKAAIAARKVKR